MLSLRGSSYNMFLLLFSLAATSPFIVDVYSEVHAETKLRLAYPDVLHYHVRRVSFERIVSIV